MRIIRGMPRSAAQSDFIVERKEPEEPVLVGPIGDATGPVELPRAILRTTQASPQATRWVMGFTFFVLAVLLVLCAIGPHIPAGE
jgi:hypothetical protein